MFKSVPRGLRRMLGTVVAVVLAAGIIAVAEPATAATSCSRSWHIITHGETNLNLEPQIAADGLRPLHAIGGPEYWNQQFLFCRDPDWGADHYAIYANMSGRYCNTIGGDRAEVSCDSPAIEGLEQLFEIYRYDSVWWYIRTVHTNAFFKQLLYPRLGGLELPRNPIVSDAPLTRLAGRHLFRITPSNLMA